MAIAGGGPAGLATAIEARRRGLEVTVFERRSGPLDKACGEGLMPAGVRALERLGAMSRLELRRCAPLRGIRYLQEDHTVAEGRFRSEGLGVRRTALVEALRSAAVDAGVRLVEGAEVRAASQRDGGVQLEVDHPQREFELLVVADGLASPLRRALGLEGRAPAFRRFGLRRHFAGVWAGDCVEVHWARGAECYLTPVGRDELGVAFLFSAEDHQPASFQRLLELFPRVCERVARGSPSSDVRGAGPMARRARSVAHGRIALVGDAAGYLDALTGEGLSLGFAGASLLGNELERWAAGDPRAPERYARGHAALMARYLRATSAVLCLSRFPSLRPPVVRLLARHPRWFDAALAHLGGAEPLPDPAPATR